MHRNINIAPCCHGNTIFLIAPFVKKRQSLLFIKDPLLFEVRPSYWLYKARCLRSHNAQLLSHKSSSPGIKVEIPETILYHTLTLGGNFVLKLIYCVWEHNKIGSHGHMKNSQSSQFKFALWKFAFMFCLHLCMEFNLCRQNFNILFFIPQKHNWFSILE